MRHWTLSESQDWVAAVCVRAPVGVAEGPWGAVRPVRVMQGN